uniref:Secreted protein n=1 Tax=Elaeophora elaphi TaxID=1147741 RepID=A0A0R3RH67_9BILA
MITTLILATQAALATEKFPPRRSGRSSGAIPKGIAVAAGRIIQRCTEQRETSTSCVWYLQQTTIKEWRIYLPECINRKVFVLVAGTSSCSTRIHDCTEDRSTGAPRPRLVLEVLRRLHLWEEKRTHIYFFIPGKQLLKFEQRNLQLKKRKI